MSIAIWAGGLAVLLVAISGASDLLPGGRRLFLTMALPRFSWMAITAFVAIGLTGFYAGYLQVGALHGLTDTKYGRQLLYKLGALAVVLMVASLNLFLISRRVEGMTDEEAGRWWKRFGVLASLEVIGVIVILFFAGRLTELEPSRDVLALAENQKEISLVLDDRASTLSIAPGSAGPNHFRLDVGGDVLDPGVTASLLFVPPVDMAGDKAVPLERTTGNAFEAHSAAMSVTGPWTITVTVSKVGAFQWSQDVTFDAPERTVVVASIATPSWVSKPVCDSRISAGDCGSGRHRLGYPEFYPIRAARRYWTRFGGGVGIAGSATSSQNRRRWGWNPIEHAQSRAGY